MQCLSKVCKIINMMCNLLKLWFHNYRGLWELAFLHDYRNNLRLSSGLGVSGFSAVDLFNVVSDDFLVLVFVLRDFLSCEFASFVSLPEELPSHSESDLQPIRIPHQCHAASQLGGQKFFFLCTKLSPCTHKSQHVKCLAAWSTLRLLFPYTGNKNQYREGLKFLPINTWGYGLSVAKWGCKIDAVSNVHDRTWWMWGIHGIRTTFCIKTKNPEYMILQYIPCHAISNSTETFQTLL